jgi:hypothetical protein
VLILLVLARSVVNAVLVLLAWPREPELSLPRPRFRAVVISCAGLTVLVGLVMAPVVTLMFGAALLPFSWPYLAAVPILLGTAVALSQGGIGPAWWRRLPPMCTVAWLIATFLVLSVASVLMTHLGAPGAVAVAGLAGVADARAWYELTARAARCASEKPPHPWVWRATLWRIRRSLQHRTSWVPVAPLAAVTVLALVVGLTRLAFTGTVRFAPGTRGTMAGEIAGSAGDAGVTGAGRASVVSSPAAGGTDVASSREPSGPASRTGAILVVGGFGSSCCHVADGLRAGEPGWLVRQFSYLGLNPAGQPLPYGRAAGNLPIQVLGDRMAVQVEDLYRRSGAPVDVVAESEGTLGLYAMLARHPHVPVRSIVLLSPIVEPGQLGQAGGTVPGAALSTLNSLVGGMSPYGSSGAEELIDSVGEVGATYFAMVSRRPGLPWLAVIPLADAVTLPSCPWPRNIIFVDAFHGGLMGNAWVRQMIESFLSHGRVPAGRTARLGGASQRDLRTAASLISAAAAAWRMPELHRACRPS